MHRSLRQYLWVIHVAILLLGGLFVALGVNSVITSMIVEATPIAPPPKIEIKDPGDEPGASASLGLQDGRNLFNQTVEDEEGVAAGDEEATDAVEEEPVPPVPTAAPGEPQPTDLRVQLMGTRVASEKRYSMALLKDLDEETSMSKRVGQSFMEDATVVHIGRDIVYFKRHSKGDAVEYIDLYLEVSEIMARSKAAEKAAENPVASRGATRAKSSAAQPAARPSTARGGSASDVDPNAVKKTGSNAYSIPREMAEIVRANPKILQDPKFGPPPKIQPVYKNQQISGFRVNGVSRGSVYSRLGIRNGDVIVNVNGQVVDNPQKALSFFDQLNPDTPVKLQVNRKGRPTTISYSMATEEE